MWVYCQCMAVSAFHMNVSTFVDPTCKGLLKVGKPPVAGEFLNDLIICYSKYIH